VLTVGRATEQNEDMIDLLRNLKDRVIEQDRQQIENLLAQVRYPFHPSAPFYTIHSDRPKVVDDVSDASASLDPPRPLYHDAIHGEADVSAEVGSDQDLDNLDEDVLQTEESRATGFVGKSSELQWLRSLRQSTDRPREASFEFEGPYGPPGDTAEASLRRTEALQRRRQQDSTVRVPTSASTFYLDNNRIDVDHTVNPFELPPRETAQTLLDSYMMTVQSSFPMLSETLFKHQFDGYYTSVLHGTSFAASPKWLAILNLVFAIGAKYMHLIEPDRQSSEQHYHIYFSRAHILGIDGPSLIGHPDLLQIQITGLLAFYFLSIGHVNR